ncbi:cupin domain-containing protein [Paraburkholderia sp. SIMBA_027]|uniref:cupin domain-containing protein n=1 Tax=Paraburkholderia sp. SIMBA_027 TaxID=3085770 RepID=UPI0039796E6D
MSGGLDAGGNWAFSFNADGLFRCFSLVSGTCWLVMERDGEPIALREGDFIDLAIPTSRTCCETGNACVRSIIALRSAIPLC